MIGKFIAGFIWTVGMFCIGVGAVIIVHALLIGVPLLAWHVLGWKGLLVAAIAVLILAGWPTMKRKADEWDDARTKQAEELLR